MERLLGLAGTPAQRWCCHGMRKPRKPKTPVRWRINRPRNGWLIPFSQLHEDEEDFLVIGGPDQTKDTLGFNDK